MAFLDAILLLISSFLSFDSLSFSLVYSFIAGSGAPHFLMEVEDEEGRSGPGEVVGLLRDGVGRWLDGGGNGKVGPAASDCMAIGVLFGKLTTLV